MSETPKSVPAGLSPANQTVGLTGLVPFEILAPPPVEIALQPGALRVWIELPAGWSLETGAPLELRVCGGEAGLDLERNGQIVRRSLTAMPLELPYAPRAYPAPPPAGEMALDLAFHYRRADGSRGIQDVQWRQPVVWRAGGGRTIELRFTLKG